MDLFDAKYKINEKVKYLDLVGVVIDAKLHENLGVVYLVKYEDGSELWALEDSLDKLSGDEQ